MIKVLHKVDAILGVVSERESVSFGDLQRALGIHKATLSNILKTLTHLGYVERTLEGNVIIGARLAELARPRLSTESLQALAESTARDLAEATGETVTIGCLKHGERFNLAKAVTRQTVSVDARLEVRPSPFDTTTGRVLLAFSEPAQVTAALQRKGLPGERWEEVTSEEELHGQLAQIREQGYAEQFTAGGEACAVAMPVLAPHGNVVCAIGVAVPAFRFKGEHGQTVISALRTSAQRMQQALLEHPVAPTVSTEP